MTEYYKLLLKLWNIEILITVKYNMLMVDLSAITIKVSFV